jgi:wyosine [tRNA(Phe)-imidazoG37] synthetase (radical SAM superfamily)
VPDGEPTLDANLGREIALLKPLGIPIAVITNASLIWREDVREDLRQADWVSLKIDSTSEKVWRRIDRPHGALRLSSILDGMLEFAGTYKGELVTETMLVQGVNDGDERVQEVAHFLAHLKPDRAYLAIPTRPPAEVWAHAPDEESIVRAYQILGEKVEQVEYLIGYEGNAFASTGNPEEDLLGITAVHPMREEAMSEFLARAGADWSIVDGLITRGQIIELEYEGRKFYLRKLHKGQGGPLR